MGFLRTPNEAKIVPEVNQVPVAVLESSSSDDEEEVGQPIHLPVYQPRRSGQSNRRSLVLQALKDGITCRTCKVGRRWSRRIDNGMFLQNLIKQSDDPCEDNLQDLQPSAFEKLLCDEKAMEVWESFISQPEEQQNKILTKHIAFQHAKERERKPRLDKHKLPAGKKCFKRICPIVQDFLSNEAMPKSTLLTFEPCLIEFFLAQPEGQYVTDPLGNDDRKVLHGLAQYLELHSQSFNSETSYDQRCTRVTNPKNTFNNPPVLLSEYLGIS